MKKLLLLITVFISVGVAKADDLGRVLYAQFPGPEKWQCEYHRYLKLRNKADVVADLQNKGWVESTAVLKCGTVGSVPPGFAIVCMCKKLN